MKGQGRMQCSTHSLPGEEAEGPRGGGWPGPGSWGTELLPAGPSTDSRLPDRTLDESTHSASWGGFLSSQVSPWAGPPSPAPEGVLRRGWESRH